MRDNFVQNRRLNILGTLVVYIHIFFYFDWVFFPQVEIDWDERPYLNVVTNNTLGDLYEKNATQVGVVFDGTNSQVNI